MNLSAIAKQERALPKLWDNGFHTERVDFYTLQVVEHPEPWGDRADIAEMIAAMMMESGLDNLALGNNAKNGSDNPFIGVGWCQLDTGYHTKSIELLHELRNDPRRALDYIAQSFGPDGLVKHRGTNKIWLRKERWYGWDPKKIDPQPYEDEEGRVIVPWNPLTVCLQAYDRVTA